ncbi:MAG: Ig-like domain-containing protein, partial [Clostridia bacterium]|nr:Ig-like domain-containing protein [Clostridia bacterium]
MKKASFFTRAITLILLTALCVTCLVIGVVASDGDNEMTGIKSDFAEYLAQDTKRIENDGYVGALEYTIYYNSVDFGQAQGGYRGTNVILYCVNTNTERVGKDSNATIIKSMLDRGYMVVVIDYLNNPLATGHALDDSAQLASREFRSGKWVSASEKIAAVSTGKEYYNVLVCPSGHNVLLNQVFWEVDKHSASGTLEKIVENWNTDFKGTKAERLVKWATGDTTDTRKTVATASDGTSPVWYNASGSADENGLYTKVKYTVANSITDCVNPDGSPLDLDLVMHITYPTNPEAEVPVLSVSCCWGYPTMSEKLGTDLASQHTGALFRGYAGAMYEYLWHPMATDESFGYYDGKAQAGSVTGDHMNYSIHIYNDKLINTASQRYLRYLALSDSTYKFDIDNFACIGVSKGASFSYIGDAKLQDKLVDPSLYSGEALETEIDKALAALTPERVFDGHHGETRYQAGEVGESAVITGGGYVGDKAILGGEKQPWLTYNGEEIISGVQLTYASNGGSDCEFLEGHSPIFVCAHMNDEWNSAFGSANAALLAANTMNIPVLYFEVFQAHEFAYKPDMIYNVETYDAFFDFAGFYLKDEPVKVLYTDPYKNDGKISLTDKIEIQFSGAVELSEVERITVTGGGKALSGSWSSLFGGTKWVFTPYEMKGDTSYVITVPADLKGTNGTEMGTAYTSGFMTEADDAIALDPTSGSYYSVTAPTSLPEGMDSIVFRFAVTNNAANVAELYEVEGVGATEGTLIGKVNLKGAGIYEIDITDYTLDNGGKAATLFLSAGKAAGTSEIKHLDLSGVTDVTAWAPYQLVKLDENGNEAASGDSAISVYINPTTYNAGDVNYSKMGGAFAIKNLIGSSALTDADYGRMFTVKVKFYDTVSRTLQLKMRNATSQANGVLDTQAALYNLTTRANEWGEFEFPYVVYDSEYGAGASLVKELYISISSTGDTKEKFYLSDVTVTETVTDITVGSAEVAYKALGKVAYKAPEAATPLALYNGSTLVSAYSSWKSALGAYKEGYTLKLTDNYTLTNADLYSDFGTKAANIVIDLNGYTVYSENTTNSLLWLKNTSKAIVKTTVTLKNGGVVLGARPLISYEGSTSAGNGKSFAVDLENITVTLKTRAPLTKLISDTSVASGVGTDVDISLKECDINIGDEDKRVVAMLNVFPRGEGSLDLYYSVTGGSISVSHPRWITITSASSYSKYFEGSDGYLKLYVPAPYAPSKDVPFAKGNGYANFSAVSTVNNVTEYALEIAEGSTPYGIIPKEYEDTNAYPFAVFKDGVFVGAYADWANGNESSALSNSKDVGSVILLRSNYTYTSWYSNISQTYTDTLVDLGGFTFTTNTKVFEATKKTNHNTGITIKNGTFVLTGTSPFIEFATWGTSYTGGYGFDFDFENVTFKLTSASAKAFILSCASNSTSKSAYGNLTFTDCVFDTSAVNNNALCLFDTSISLYEIKATLKGCEIKAASALTFLVNSNGNASSSLTFAENESGEFATVTLPSSVAFGNVTVNGGKNVFTKKSDNGTYATYELIEADEVIETETKYGTIPEAFADVNQYPFVVFNGGQFVGAYALWGAKDAVTGALTNAKPAGSVILLRRNFTYSDDYFNNLSQFNTGIIVDLGGFTFTVVHQPMFFAQKKGANDSSFTVKNGNIVLSGGESVIKVSSWHAGNKYSGGNKFDFVFDNVNIKLESTAGTSNIISYNSFNDAAAPNAIISSITLNNCEIDLSEAAKSVTLFNMAGALGQINATVNGGKLITSEHSVTFANTANANAGSSFTLGSTAAGDYLTLVMPIANAAPTESFGGLKFTKTGDDGTLATYMLLPPSIVTEYGEIPATYYDANQYPLVVFRNGEFIGAYSLWSGWDKTGALPKATEPGSVILLRRNFTYGDGDNFNNLSHFKEGVVIDLNGFTFTVTHQPMLKAQKKTANDTKITVKNGSIVLSAGAPIIEVSSWSVNNTYAGGNKFDFIFDNVDIKLTSEATISSIITYNNFNSSAAPNAIPVSITLNECEIDISAAKNNVTLFGMSGELGKITAVMKGGKIIGSAAGFTLANTDGANAGSSLTFVKSDKSGYTTVTLPSSVAFENVTVNGGKYVFVKASDNGTEATYTLTTSATVGIDFVPKASITLGSELVYNVYVPVSDLLKSYTVNGLTFEDAEIVTLEDGKSYYHIEVAMPASEAAEIITLKTVLTINGSEYAGSFTMSIPSYAKKIIEAQTSPEEVTLVKDVLAYIRAAYVYFDAEGKDEAIATIDAILGDYESEFGKVEGNTNTAEGLKTVIIALGAKPAIRFVIPEGASLDSYTFKAGGRTLTYTTGTYT